MAKTTAIEKLLTPVEQNRLAELEPIIERGQKSFEEVGQALIEIQQTKLYREYGSFSQYVSKRWGMVRRRAYQLMDATRTVKILTDVNNCTQPFPILPGGEGQTRLLTGLKRKNGSLDEPKIIDTWAKVIETAPKAEDGKPIITAKHVSAVIRGPKKTTGAQRGSSKDTSEMLDGLRSIEKILKEIRQCRPKQAQIDEVIERVHRLQEKVASLLEHLERTRNV